MHLHRLPKPAYLLRVLPFVYVFGWVLLLGITNTVTAQTDKPYLSNKDKELPEKARVMRARALKALEIDDFRSAIQCLKSALEIAPNYIDAQILFADSYNGLGDLTRAATEFEKVVALDSMYSPRVLYVLGKIEQKQKRYLEAARYYERFAAIDRTELKMTALQLARNNRFMDEGYKHPVPFTPLNMGDSINTRSNEYLPTLTIDGQTLLFTRKVGNQEDFYTAHRRDSTWSAWTKAVPLGPPINTDDNEGAETISADGKTLVFTACQREDGFGSCDLYLAEYKNGVWTTPQNMGKPVNSASWESQPALSADGKTLYFVSNRISPNPEKSGRHDLWRTRRRTDGTWTPPTNIEELNTPNEETSPFLHPDGKTLYFASDGYAGFGGADIFVSRLGDDGKWQTPVNLGYPINTEKNDDGLIVAPDARTAIYATEKADTRGGRDLYTFTLPLERRPTAVTFVTGRVTDAKTGMVMQNAAAVLTDLGKATTAAEIRTDKNGDFLLCLPAGVNYGLAISEKGYVFYSANFELSQNPDLSKPYRLNDIALQPIDATAANKNGLPANTPKGTAIVLRNIFFATSSATLKPESETELTRLKTLLEENPALRIQINGHTDNVGTAATNLELSQRRAEAVLNYLTTHGIAASRLTARGFGFTQPLSTNDTEAGRQTNRRTEFEILR